MTDWTYYASQDEVEPTAVHHDWLQELRELGPIRLPAESEDSFYQNRAKPKAPTYQGWTLRPKLISLKSQMSWGNPGEQATIHHHMSQTDAAIRRDADWVALLKRCREDPAEGYLHTVLPSGEILPFSDALALTYEYPCTLGKEQDGLHLRLVYSSLHGIPLIAPVKSGRLRVHTRREQARAALNRRAQYVGYISNEGVGGEWCNTNEVPNQ